MDLYIGNTYIILFFIYGLAFYSMGVSALLQNIPKESNFPLSRSIKFLGYFGLTHGFTEWILMIVIGNVYPELEIELLAFATFINAISFTFLWYFGMKLIEYKEKKRELIKIIPWIVFAIWTMNFLLSYMHFHGRDILWFSFHNIMSRYFIGLPGGLTAAFALYKNAQSLEKLNLKRMSLKFKLMAVLFAAYGILAGLIVKSKSFFPANLINKEFFEEFLGFPVELGRAVTALGITILFIGLIDVFRWETEHKIDYLSKEKIASQERRKLGRELHDVVLQNLFATGLQIENLIDTENDLQQKEVLQNVKVNLNDTILQIREFIGKVGTKQIEIDNLKLKLVNLIGNLESSSHMPIELQYNIPDVTLGHLSPNKATQMYYIIQEALCNTLKHSNATKLVISINSTLNSVIATIQDNGVGFNPNNIQKDKSYGILSMKERAVNANGNLNIFSSSKGTTISVTIPWEGYENDDTKY